MSLFQKQGISQKEISEKTINIEEGTRQGDNNDLESQKKRNAIGSLNNVNDQIEEEEEEKYEDLINSIDDRIPQIYCDKGYAHSFVNRVCTIKTCNKKLLCDMCLETDHAPLQKYAKKFSEFFKSKKERKVIKEKAILDIELFLQEKEQFMKKLDFAYKMATQTVEKEFILLQENICNIIDDAKKEVLSYKKQNYETSKQLLDSLQPKLDDIYFNIEKEMKNAVKASDFNELNEIIKKVVEFPNQQKIEQLSNEFRLISFYIKEFESEASLLILKQISPKIESYITESLQKISNEAEAKRLLIEDNDQQDQSKYSIWNSKSVVNYKTIQRAEQDPILCACEVDNTTLVFGTGSPGNNVLVYDKQTNQFTNEFNAHESSVMSIIHYHDNIIITGGSDGVIKFWDIVDTENFKTFQAHNEIMMCLCKVVNKRFATCAFDNTIKIWNYESASQSPEGTLVGHTEGVFQIIMLSEVDQLLASCSADFNVKVWNLNRYECYGTLKGHTNQVNTIQKYGEDNIISGGDDNTIIIWNWKTFEIVNKLEVVPFAIWSMRLMNDENSLVICGEDLSIFIINLQNKSVQTKLFGHKSFPRSLLQLKQGILVTFGYDFFIKFWRSRQAIDI